MHHHVEDLDVRSYKEILTPKNEWLGFLSYGQRYDCPNWRMAEGYISRELSLHETLINRIKTLPEIERIIECEGEDAEEIWIIGENLNSKVEWEIIKIINAIERKFDTIFELRVIDSKFKEKIAIPTDGKKIFEK